MKSSYVMFIVSMALFLIGCAQMEKTKIKPDPILSPGQHPQAFEKKIIKTVRCKYLLFLPEDYGKINKQWPMILFLHGAGERGSDLEIVKKHGPPKIVKDKKDFPFMVVSPQCPANSWWPDETDVLISLLDDIVARYDIDINRVYLTGLSMGGYGTWHLAYKYPDRFAAIAPICGGGIRLYADKLKDIPIWAFHGAKDKVVPVKESEEMVKAINARGGNARLTVYPDAGHDSWTVTYNNQELYDWFLKHRRSKKK